MTQRRSILLLVLGLAAILQAWAAPGRYPITAEQVAAAVTNQGVQVDPDQITLFSHVMANVAGPELKVQSIERAGDQRALARLACVDARQCLPFVVALHISKETALSAAAFNPPAPAETRSRPSPLTVRAGAPARLLLEGPHIQISLTVICLDNGAPGQIIRATDRDHRRQYIVQVKQDGTLEGKL